jgi:hypothetical protein
MSTPAESPAPDKGKKETIFINDHRYQVEARTMTGAELKALDSIPSGNTLFLETPGPDPDQRIGDADEVTLKSGMRFYDLPPIQRGDVLEEEIEALDGRYQNVRSHAGPEGRWVSVETTLPDGWQAEDPRLAVAVPPNFPDGRPDGFWVTTPLVQPNGGQLGPQREEEGRSWAKLCWQVQVWDPAREHLWRYLKAMERWFAGGWQ